MLFFSVARINSLNILRALHTAPMPATLVCYPDNLPIWSKNLGGSSEVERSVFLLCSFSDRLRGRMKGDVRRRTAQGKNVGCGGQRGCQCVRHRWHSPKGHGQTPTGKVYHLGDTKTQTQRKLYACVIMSMHRIKQVCTCTNAY